MSLSASRRRSQPRAARTPSVLALLNAARYRCILVARTAPSRHCAHFSTLGFTWYAALAAFGPGLTALAKQMQKLQDLSATRLALATTEIKAEANSLRSLIASQERQIAALKASLNRAEQVSMLAPDRCAGCHAVIVPLSPRAFVSFDTVLLWVYSVLFAAAAAGRVRVHLQCGIARPVPQRVRKSAQGSSSSTV